MALQKAPPAAPWKMDWKGINREEGGREKGLLGVKSREALVQKLVLRVFPECHLVAKGRGKGTEAERWVPGVHKYPQLQTCAA